jgi:outer membrane protein TolC
VLDAGRGRALVQAQQAAWDEARAAYRATVLGALQDVEDELVAMARSRTQIDRLREAAEAARDAARLAEQRYAAGLADFPNVLLSQRTLLSAQDALAGAITGLATQQVRLLLALGTGEPAGSAPGTPTGPSR